jgi:Ca2+-binding EF-hand superfamily protein
MFDAIDADGDGTITMRELRKAVVALRKLDVDEDGNLTREEALGGFVGGPPNGPGGDQNAMIDRMMQGHRDGDGKLSPNELPPPMAQMLQNADTNGDGALDRAELAVAMRNAQPRFGGGPGQFGGPAVDPRQGQNLLQYDQNGDGQLSANEVPRQLRGMLQGSDQNGNGVLDRDEIDIINQRMNERIRGSRQLPPGVSAGPEGLQRNRREQ